MKLKLENFMSHDSTEVELPDSGIVLVHGANGSGKSSLIEGVAYGLWGKTLRGSSPWRSDESPGSVEFHVSQPDLHVIRKWSGKQQKLSFCHDGKTETYETRTKCQTALDTVVGPFDLWRRSCVFSSSDAASFSTAADADRKRMLEKLLGLEWFDEALRVARSDFKDASTSLDKSIDRLSTLEARKHDLLEKVEFFTSQLKDLVEPDDYDDIVSKFTKYKKLRAAAKQEVKLSSSDVHRKQRELDRSEHKLESLTEQLDALNDQTCHTCGQPVPEEVRQDIQTSVENETGKLAELRTSAATWLEEVKEDITEAQREIEELDSRIEEAGALVRTSAAQADSLKKAQRGVKQANLDLTTIKMSAVEIDKSLEALKPKVAELEACTVVLGLKGVRAHILGETLGSIESVANRWLDRLSEGRLQLELRPYSEKGVKDAISLRVNGSDFRAASGGERRRVDVSILLALSQIGLSTVGVQDEWPIIFDEVFDALDARGITQVIGALQELSSSRPVIVISHTWGDALIEMAGQIIKVEEGEICTT